MYAPNVIAILNSSEETGRVAVQQARVVFDDVHGYASVNHSASSGSITRPHSLTPVPVVGWELH